MSIEISGRETHYIVLAHVDQDSGFFKELDGGRIKQFAESEIFRNFVLGFHKLRTFEKLPAIITGLAINCLLLLRDLIANELKMLVKHISRMEKKRKLF